MSDKLPLGKSILALNKKKTKFKLKKRYKLHFFTTKPPCGGCSLDLTHGGSDFAFTGGAKALKNFWVSNDKSKIEEKQSSDLMTKPFRSDTPVENRSASLSCSDKIMVWNILGLQGKILGLFLQPVYMDSITIVGNPAHESTIKKGLTLQSKLQITKEIAENSCLFYKEKRISVKHKVNEPMVRILDQNLFASLTKDTMQQTLSYEAAKKDSKLSTISLGFWWNCQAERVSAEDADIIVGTTGLKPGANPKNSDSLKLSPALSKAYLAKMYQAMFDGLGIVCAKNTSINIFKTQIQSHLTKTSEELIKNGVISSVMKYDLVKNLNFREMTIKSKLKKVFALWTIQKNFKDLNLVYKTETLA